MKLLLYSLVYLQAAEERYSHELLAHAESIKTIEGLKQQLSTVQSTVRDHKTAVETAKAKLATSEDSWKHQKETLDKEVADLNQRYNPFLEILLAYADSSKAVEILRLRTVFSTSIWNPSVPRLLKSDKLQVLLHFPQQENRTVTRIPSYRNFELCSHICAKRKKSWIYDSRSASKITRA